MRKFSLFFIILFLAVLFSCRKESGAKESVDQFDTERSGEKKSATVPYWYPAEKKICLVFGYGYNEKTYVQSVVDKLTAKYGFDDGSPEGGLILPFVFPDDFPANRITRLSGMVENRELAGLIIVGAPENTNYAIANLEDEYSEQETMMPYPVYVFFPQDDVSGIEATANFVVDRSLEGGGNVDDESGKEEIVQTQVKDLDKILDNAVEYMLLTKKPLPSDENLLLHVERIMGKSYKVSRYVDPESGLQSINHFVIEDAEK